MSIADKITQLTTIRDNIRAALVGKGVAASNHNYENFAEDISSISSGGITPTGTKDITANGVHDVTNYASANVSVPVGIFPSGTANITTNGTHNIREYENAKVAVPVGVFPSGTKDITENGTYDVKNFASASVAVPRQALISSVIVITISSDITSVSASIAGYQTTGIIENDKAYVVIPREYTGTCTLTGYTNGVAVITSSISISSLAIYYTDLITSFVIFNNGTWSSSITDTSFSDGLGYGTIRNENGRLIINSKSALSFRMNQHIDFSSYKKLKFTGRVCEGAFEYATPKLTVGLSQPGYSIIGKSEYITSTTDTSAYYDMTQSDANKNKNYNICVLAYWYPSGSGIPYVDVVEVSKIEAVV